MENKIQKKCDKVVFFDFDGTLTYDSPNPYEVLLKNCGFIKKFIRSHSKTNTNIKIGILKNKDKTYKKGNVEQYKKSLSKKFYTFVKNFYCKTFIHKLLSTKLVLNFFAKLFKVSGIKKSDLKYIAENTKMLKNIREGFLCLKNNNYKICIISGGLKPIIIKTLGSIANLVDDICAPDVIFDKNNVISKISTKGYDYEGKAKYILQKLKEYNIKKDNAVFVGNDTNDIYVGKLAKCKTICVNAEKYVKSSKNSWTAIISKTNNFYDILHTINRMNKKQALQIDNEERI